jgi:hypothetical protein
MNVCIAAIGIVAVAATAVADQKKTGQIDCIVELYTSQGCSSCPPADALLKSYVAREGVLPLSFNVDIWDNLGWKDTLASAKYTKRQRAYARMRGDGQVYTPQAIINGMTHAVGSDSAAIDAEIKTTEVQIKEMRVALGVASDGSGLHVDSPAWPQGRATPVDATLWLVKFTPQVAVEIKHGENAGKTITYTNVVRELASVGGWMGEAKATTISRTALSGCLPGTCALLLQQGGTGSILGAAWVPPVAGI